MDERLIRIPRAADYDFRLARETYTTVKPGVDLLDVRPRKVAEIRVADPKPTPSLGLDRSAILRLTAEGKLSIDTASELLDVIYGVK